MEVVAQIKDNNMVELTLINGDVKKKKIITLADYFNTLKVSINKKKVDERASVSEIYPTFNHIHMVQKAQSEDGSATYILLRTNKSVDMSYENTIFKNVGLPNLLFAIKIYKGVLQTIKIAAVKSCYITEDMKIFYYPLAHVSSPTSSACLGGNRLADKDFKLTSASMAYKIPDMFLSMPNGNDYYKNVNNSNLQMRPILEALSENEFPDKWLKKSNMTYKEWVNEII